VPRRAGFRVKHGVCVKVRGAESDRIRSLSLPRRLRKEQAVLDA
jgi:hypothetical protein